MRVGLATQVKITIVPSFNHSPTYEAETFELLYIFSPKQIRLKSTPLFSVPAASDMKAEATARLAKLVRNRRNVPVLAVPQFKRLPDFWGWYKYFMDTHNQEGVSRDSCQCSHQVSPHH